MWEKAKTLPKLGEPLAYSRKRQQNMTIWKVVEVSMVTTLSSTSWQKSGNWRSAAALFDCSSIGFDVWTCKRCIGEDTLSLDTLPWPKP